MKKKGNKVPPKTLNCPKVDPRGINGEEIKHQIAVLHEMIKEEAKKLSELKDDINQKTEN